MVQGGSAVQIRTVARHGSFLEAAELFDHNFFGISAKQVGLVADCSGLASILLACRL